MTAVGEDRAETERRMSQLVLDKLRVWSPGLGEADLDRPVIELDLDSLDALEITQLLEREYQVKADLRTTAGFRTLRGYVVYFLGLVHS